MLYLRMLILFMIFNASKVNNQPQKVTITGIAYDAKRSAIVTTKQGRIYYIDKLPYWDKKYLDKKVKVTGELIIESNKRNITVQQVEGTVYIIKKAKWQLAK